tara:strand:+ start:177 stop:1175 length:999 start_codon:yes stop_codon:yes gene_type:complete
VSSKESEIIKYIKNLSESNTNLDNNIIKIGDDTTLVYSKNNHQLITTDASVENTHFNINKISPEDIGWKCAISNISDIAAMGGEPKNALVTLGIPESTENIWVNSVMDGIHNALNKYGANIVGGDVVKSKTIFINITLTGNPYLNEKSEPIWLSRTNAKPGDCIAVTGSLGASLNGLSLLDSSEEVRLNNPSWSKHIKPEARVEIGKLALSEGIRTGMDISDGLVEDLNKLSLVSKVDLEIYTNKIPIFSYLKSFLPETESIDLALNSGEEYELILIGNEKKLNNIKSLTNIEISIIGKVTRTNISKPSIKIFSENMKEYSPKITPWSHFNE